MLAKFTPFGKSNSGKTTALRVLTYLLYSHADPRHYVHFQRANQNDRGKIYPSPSALPISTIFRTKGKDKSADWRISLNLLVSKENMEKSVRIAIATPGDNEQEIVKNWDFAWNNYIYKLSKNEPDFIQPDFFISPCSEGRAQDEEKLEQNWHIQNRNLKIDFLYWFQLPTESNLRNLLDKKKWKVNLSQLLEELESNDVFSAGKKNSSVKKMTRQDKLESIMIALLIEDKIYELANIL